MKAAIVKYKIYPKVKIALEGRLSKFPDHIIHSRNQEA
jgi:hypothetical protein